MKLILLSGGSGKRLWPLSNEARPKQFLKLLKGPDNQWESMIQRIWRQVASVGLENSCYITTNQSQIEILNNQLTPQPHLPLIVEPQSRDTFPAIALAATYLYSKAKVDLSEVVCVFPVDAYVDDSFLKRIKDLERLVQESQASAALMGVSPYYASEKYGYIVPIDVLKGNSREYCLVDKFVEKPSVEDAKALIEKKALWNCGVVAFKLGMLISLLEEKGLPIHYEEMLSNFGSLSKVSLDYEILERTKNLVVIPYNGNWRDMGTWDAIAEQINTPIIGRGILSTDSLNTQLINELNIPIIILGLSNTIVASSPDGILVADKSASSKIKDYLNTGVSVRPMYEERRWGWYHVLDHIKYSEGNEVLVKRLFIKKGENISYQFHKKRSEVWTIISGLGMLALNDKIKNVSSHDVIEIATGSKHAIKAITDLEIIEVQKGTQLVEDDIERIYKEWGEIEKKCTVEDSKDKG
ncbi:sugar phosphate nucleotidyltransferase [Ammoniphilus sp. YIM 78166]|uniref:sugar phosphate nucleotidyltransferase n=1 Tax=Ammoniphilus sp. YIM 78166 TaxID=1644106 RepID=UPI00106F96CF|nr:sugar phosphate nucleotidyltransferase [Ammoniphilus sp. YIM 78166]